MNLKEVEELWLKETCGEEISPIDTRLKKGWIRRLTSGEYVQANGALLRANPDGDRFCCLGVGCEIHAQETGGAWDTDDIAPTIYHTARESYLGQCYTMPDEVMDYFSLYECEQNALAELNDNGATFIQIAYIIKKYL